MKVYKNRYTPVISYRHPERIYDASIRNNQLEKLQRLASRIDNSLHAMNSEDWGEVLDMIEALNHTPLDNRGTKTFYKLSMDAMVLANELWEKYK